MFEFPADIFTEPDDVDPDTLKNLGPLAPLAGIWEGRRGLDVHLGGEGAKDEAFYERYELQPIDPQLNGPQLLYGLRYWTHVLRPNRPETFHDQVGYWLWEPATGLILQSLTIPRGQVLLAAGQAKAGDKRISVSATRGDARYGICTNAFLDEAFRTDRYSCAIAFNDDGSWSYEIETDLLIRGTQPFSHRDTNTLTLVAPPQPNPLQAILSGQSG